MRWPGTGYIHVDCKSTPDFEKMSILKYFAKKKDSGDNFRLPDVIVSVSTTLSPKDIRSANESVKPLVKQLKVNKPARKVSKREKYNQYSPEQREQKLVNMQLRMERLELLDISPRVGTWHSRT